MPFLPFDPEIRTVNYTTNVIESIHARFRRAVRVRGNFPNETAALTCDYLTVRSLDPTGTGGHGWTNREAVAERLRGRPRTPYPQHRQP